ncbi:MAG: outer membrane beta-barrel protein [Cytophagaceae bacterium]|nr:outer membrane beta-barrel protein [Cytophagaceae bacterium]MBL0302895.1 outer membrane beta-barrel protein [Cytophagaceae bacterium]MBL0325725.1 outer membrane beta-barrel protein [Cytophagaceae bacterium]
MHKKIFWFFLFFLISKAGFSQIVESDSSIAEKDTSGNLEIIKLKYDTLSYAEEYRRDYWRYQSGLRFGISQGRFFINEYTIDRLSPSGNPVIDANGKIVKNTLINNDTYNTGFNTGLFMRMVRGSFMFQPELIYSSKSGIFDILNTDGSLSKRVKGSISSIDVPALIGVRSKTSRVFLGPTFNFPFAMNSEMKNALKDFKNEKQLNHKFFNRPIMNFNVGFGFEFSSFFFDVRFEKGIKSYSVQTLGPVSSPKVFNLMTDAFHFNIGYIKK